VAHTLSEDGKGGPPNNGIVLGQYQTRVFDMASAYATLAASGVYHPPHFVQKVVNSDGQVLFDAAKSENNGEQRIPKAVADAAHRAGIATSFPGVAHTLSEDGKGGPPNNGIVLGQYQTRVFDMASAYATLAASGVYHRPHFVQKVVNSDGQVLFDAGTSENNGEQRIPKAVADNVTAAMAPIASYSRGHALAGGRPSAAKTGTTQLGDTNSDKDAWMVGYTPSLSTAVWLGTAKGDVPLVTASGSPVYGSGLPSDIWKSTMDGALKGTSNESFPKPTEIGGYAGVPAPPPPPKAPPSETVIQPTIEVAPGITIPVGPPTTITLAPPPPAGGAPASPEPGGGFAPGGGVPPGGPQAPPPPP
jgi:membrane peptidoglycan carboxypeptidase